ncbi:pulmonary surfactant-associated protein B [Ammospiza nelsoni]|uniref:pulmonary surfactant-associated protein B n=1 Tax=Ammospiza nelsoni TaxID=2857394 RepID=UPI00286CB3BF|nr:pulmonary surfactant-associated protein B [Ammospiza nelsoni]
MGSPVWTPTGSSGTALGTRWGRGDITGGPCRAHGALERGPGLGASAERRGGGGGPAVSPWAAGSAVPALSPCCPQPWPRHCRCSSPCSGAAQVWGRRGGGCGVPPSAWCQDWVTALRCGALGRCPRLGQGPLEALRDAPDLDACAVCQQLLDSLRHISSVSAVEVVLDHLVGLACPHMPLVESLCKKVVNDLVHHFLQNMQHLDSWSVCAKLTLCLGEPGVVPVLEGPGSHLQGPALSPLSLPLPRCWLCRSLVARAEAAVPVRSVAAAVAGLCRALPLPVAGACQCLAERYAALALEGLLGRLGPRLLCRLFLACSGDGDGGDGGDEGTLPPPRVLEAIVVRLADCVGDEHPKNATVPALSLSLGPCALGPIFWCSGPEAARRCQAVQHCKDHVWL